MLSLEGSNSESEKFSQSELNYRKTNHQLLSLNSSHTAARQPKPAPAQWVDRASPLSDWLPDFARLAGPPWTQLSAGGIVARGPATAARLGEEGTSGKPNERMTLRKMHLQPKKKGPCGPKRARKKGPKTVSGLIGILG